MEGGGILWLRAHIADAYHGYVRAVMRGYLQLSGADMRVAYAFTINANIPPLQNPPVFQMMLQDSCVILLIVPVLPSRIYSSHTCTPHKVDPTWPRLPT
jgi:hypothetical protein